MGNLTALLEKLKPAVNAETTTAANRNSGNAEYVEKIALLNVRHTIQQILIRSSILKNMIKNGDIEIIGGMYDVETGKVDFHERG